WGNDCGGAAGGGWGGRAWPGPVLGRRSAALAAAIAVQTPDRYFHRGGLTYRTAGGHLGGSRAMRAFGTCSALVTASVVALVTSSCAAPAATSTAQAPIATSAPAGTAEPGSTRYNAHCTLEAGGAPPAPHSPARPELRWPPPRPPMPGPSVLSVSEARPSSCTGTGPSGAVSRPGPRRIPGCTRSPPVRPATRGPSARPNVQAAPGRCP